jgi:hypothetical protein
MAQARLQVSLTDADPGDYQAVYIDVKDVQEKCNTGDAARFWSFFYFFGWQSMAWV